MRRLNKTEKKERQQGLEKDKGGIKEAALATRKMDASHFEFFLCDEDAPLHNKNKKARQHHESDPDVALARQ